VPWCRGISSRRSHHSKLLLLFALNVVLVNLELDIEGCLQYCSVRTEIGHDVRRRCLSQPGCGLAWYDGRRLRRGAVATRSDIAAFRVGAGVFPAEPIDQADRVKIDVAFVADGIVDPVALRLDRACREIE